MSFRPQTGVPSNAEGSSVPSPRKPGSFCSLQEPQHLMPRLPTSLLPPRQGSQEKCEDPGAIRLKSTLCTQI